MVFTTLDFIAFMAIKFILYYSLFQNRQWQLLLVASYFFYACASPLYLIFLFAVTIVTYLGSTLISKNYNEEKQYLVANTDLMRIVKNEYKLKVQRKQKLILGSVVIILLLFLLILKYSFFVWNNVSWLLGIFDLQIGDMTLKILLPVGMSFYIFQSLGYCIDVYRQVATAEQNFFKYALYVSFFPQLLQGPIGNYDKLFSQFFIQHEFSYDESKYGLQRIAWGFFKKIVIANHLATVIDSVWGNYADYHGFVFWWFVLVMYAIQLYADFSGYMDIAIGCSQMLGITLDENFNLPYFSKDIAEFWRKWHITLGRWFKNYLFYPVLRSQLCNNIRKKYRKENTYISNTLPTVIALLITWFLIGLWHGADWSYILYGLYHGTFIILSTILSPAYHKICLVLKINTNSRIYMVFQILRTFAIVAFGYILFRPADLNLTQGILQEMFSGFGLHQTLQFGKTYFKDFFAAFMGTIVLLAVDVYHYKFAECSLRNRISQMSTIKRWSIYVSFLMAIFILGLYGKPELNQFAYFRF